MLKKLTAIFLLILYAVTMPTGASAALSGSEYTDTPALAERLDRVFSGDIGLYADASCAQPVSAPPGTSAVPLGTWYYIREEGSGSLYSGTSCYIYANAVYNTLFGDVPYHGWSSTWQVSECIASGGGGVSFRQFTRWGVRFGALLRTTPNADGSYSSNKGHSMIVLSYDGSGVTYLEGNGDGKGLIRVVTRTWDEFDRGQLSGRGYSLCFIVQPTSEYYDSLPGDEALTPNNMAGYLSYSEAYPGYSDVGQRDWYLDEVTGAVRLGLMRGRGDGRFCPESSITVAEAVTLAARLCSGYWGDEWTFHTSVPWYEPYYAYLRLWGVTLPDRDPNEPITKLELAELLAKAVPRSALEAVKDTDHFRDCDSVLVLRLRRAGVLTGSGGSFNPHHAVTRAEAAAMVSRIADRSLRAG